MNNSLNALSPLDGRYQNKTLQCAKYFSELSLIRHRIKIEVLYLLELEKIGIIRKLSGEERKLLNSLSSKNVEEVKDIN